MGPVKGEQSVPGNKEFQCNINRATIVLRVVISLWGYNLLPTPCMLTDSRQEGQAGEFGVRALKLIRTIMCKDGSTCSLASRGRAAGGTGGHTSRELLGQVGVNGGGTPSRVAGQGRVGSCDQGSHIGAGVTKKLVHGLQNVCGHGDAAGCSSDRVDNLQQGQS